MAKLLVVDDDPGMLQSLAQVLRRGGHEVVVARNGRDAMDLVRAERPDVIVTDINMPEMDGIETILEVRREREAIPIIAISGGGRVPPDLLLDSADMLGAFETLQKPLEAEALLASVERALAGGDGEGSAAG